MLNLFKMIKEGTLLQGSQFRSDKNKNWANIDNNFETVGKELDSQSTRINNLITGVEQPSEVVDARQTEDGTVYPVLGQRLNAKDRYFETQLSYAKREAVNLAKAFEKLNNAQPAIIVTQGDSVMFGADYTNGTNYTVTPDSGDSKTTPRAATTIPMRLESLLQAIYKNTNIQVINTSYAGDTAADSLGHWNVYRNQDLTIIMLGTNDNTQGVSMDDYIGAIDQIVKQHIDWGAGVILATPPLRNNRPHYWKLGNYRTALIQYAKLMSIPVIHMDDETSNLNAAAYSDATHFTELGYTELARSFAAALTGKGIIKPTAVRNGTYLQANDDLINLVSREDPAESTFYPGPAVQFPDTGQTLAKAQALQLSNGDNYYLGIYAEHENLYVFPNVQFLDDDGKLKLELTYPYAKNVSDIYIRTQNESATDTDLARRVRTYWEYDKSQANFRGGTIFNVENMSPSADVIQYLVLPNRGWHLLHIVGEGGRVNLFGFDFISAREYKLISGRGAILFT